MWRERNEAGRADEIAQSREDRDEPPQAIGGTASTAPFSQRHVGILRTVVRALVRAVLDVHHHLTLRRPVGTQLVGDHALRSDALFLQEARQQSLGGLALRRFWTTSSST